MRSIEIICMLKVAIIMLILPQTVLMLIYSLCNIVTATNVNLSVN